MLEWLTPSRAHCPTIGNEGCPRSTISRRRPRFMDQTSPPRNPAPPSTGRSPGAGWQSGRPRSWLSGPDRCRTHRRHPRSGPSSRLESGPGGTSCRAASWATVSSPFTASRATPALNARLCFLLPCAMSFSFQTATAALSLGAELSLIYLSSFLGPPQSEPFMYSCILMGRTQKQRKIEVLVGGRFGYNQVRSGGGGIRPAETTALPSLVDRRTSLPTVLRVPAFSSGATIIVPKKG